eukprot:CAMPEP_0115833042 /NCGR_PEP_ID=MMETSP0287-20121206/2970_1 /TAXON_ID=412157 /ORGANISM="Chrysochromulina rotalis, Strain UIO044" /LENGTH=134 /DNA_ID=CAMNT_0003286447 /DNA_START=100 /DNA_END=505 /DNA_ORIENTATION=+
MALGVAALPVEQMTATCTPETCCFKADPKPDCDCSWATPDTCVAGNLPEGRKCGVDQCYTFCCSSQALDCCDPVDVPPQTLYCLTCPSPKDEYCDPPKEAASAIARGLRPQSHAATATAAEWTSAIPRAATTKK